MMDIPAVKDYENYPLNELLSKQLDWREQFLITQKAAAASLTVR